MDRFVVILIICYIALILIQLIVIPVNIIDPYNNDSYVWTFWIYLIILGFFWGTSAMCQEIIILEVQPKNLTGCVNGIKMCVIFILRGIVGLIIGFLWDYSYEWFWYSCSISFAISLVFLAILVIFET